VETYPKLKMTKLFRGVNINFFNACPNESYGEDCENTFLNDLFNDLCLACVVMDKMIWNICFKSHTCYCDPTNSLFDSTKRIECNELNEITNIKLSNISLSGSLKSLKNFKKLKILDLSFNQISFSDSLNNLLPSMIEVANFTSNNVSHPSSIFEIDAASHLNFTKLVINNVDTCGVYPLTWVIELII
jgi:hypothetical protein